MSRPSFSGLEIAKVLIQWGFQPVGGRGSHRVFRYEHPDTGEVRTVVVPLDDELKTGTLREIANQAGAKDFDKFCEEASRLL